MSIQRILENIRIDLADKKPIKLLNVDLFLLKESIFLIFRIIRVKIVVSSVYKEKSIINEEVLKMIRVLSVWIRTESLIYLYTKRRIENIICDKYSHIYNDIKWIIGFYLRKKLLLKKIHNAFSITKAADFCLNKNNYNRKKIDRGFFNKQVELDDEELYFLDEVSEDEDLDDITNRHNCFLIK